ncbi:MAG: hypothetical protein CMP23_02010 [Rickettsiales bacterium]|nr:hypothetical protein [Rickettsiales bacterium]|tara:strand:- start:300 stop:737 length:438 start_codon:yes stop_codon:yes gene_type:complete
MTGNAESEPDVERSIDAVRAQAQQLYEMARTFVVTAVCGFGGASGVIFYLWRDWKLGYRVHPEWYEPFVAALVGSLIGFGLSMPFARWFQVQAGLVQVQLRMEENTRAASETAERTAQNIRDLADATMTGEWSAIGLDQKRDSGA